MTSKYADDYDFSCRHVNFKKTVHQRAPEHPFFIQKLIKFSKEGRGPYLDTSAIGTPPAFVNVSSTDSNNYM